MLRTALSRSWIFPLLFLGTPVRAGIETTAHNLTASGSSGYRSEARAGTCIFCHTPHNARPTRGLWNRSLPGTTYRLYESSTLEAALNQPTGSSRLCLSCHDGTLALGDLRMQLAAGPVSLGTLQGKASLGADLSDDHPISFVYDNGLASRKGELAEPGGLPPQIRLDDTGQLQCTTCHNPHKDDYGNFLVMDNMGSRLCNSCHRKDGWKESSHATSLAIPTTGGDPWPHTEFGTVADNGCENCHRQHAAGRAEWLLAEEGEEERCFLCHDGSVAAIDISQGFRSFSFHPIESTEGIHDPNEDPLFMERHVACGDCHEPHSVGPPAPEPGAGMDIFGRMDGVNSSGARVLRARAEYEVCYKCHGLREEADFMLTRRDNVTNVRLEFSTNNMSFHPVEATGRNTDIQGLEAGYTPSSLISCSDCHSSDQSGAGGIEGPRGPHGSVYEPILMREYQMGDPSMESFQSYSLCYGCHNRSALLADTGGFPHRLHVSDQQSSCAVCHDAHGSRRNPFLINFLERGKAGEEVVRPSAGGREEFQSFGQGTGRCFLTCHGSNHDPLEYPPQTIQ